VIEEAAGRFGTPLAFPVMDLKLEKRWLLSALGVEAEGIDTHHFTEAPGAAARARLERRLEQEPPPARVQAQLEAIGHIVRKTDLYPVGMSIGPFSLASKLLADPITPVFLAGTGATAADEPEVALLDDALALARAVVLRSVLLQIEAGARAVFIAEPAANQVFFSPRQLEAGADVFERYALAPNREVAALLAARGVDHLFHCCGEITDGMLDGFCRLHPVLLSLGSSRRLWEDAARVPRDIVLYGNLPSKRFYSDDLTPLDTVATMADDLAERMAATGHPFILGTECDTLHVPGCGDIICGKVERMLRPRATRVLP
jgi:uroporphyrinogen-III decarboxylase